MCRLKGGGTATEGRRSEVPKSYSYMTANPAALAKHQNRGMVSDSVLVDRLWQLLRTSNLRTTTATAVRRILEEEYGVDLSGRKAFIRRQIELFIDERAAENVGVYDVAEQVVAEEGAESVTNDKIGCEEDGGAREKMGEWGGKRRRKGRSDKVAKAVKKKAGGLMKPCGLCPQLESFVGASELARREVYYNRHPSIPIDRVWGQKLLCLRNSGLGQKHIVVAEEEAVAAASPTPLDHKQKQKELELDAPESPSTNANEMDLLKRDGEEEENRAAAGGDSEESEAKRPRLEENSDGLAVTDNGFQEDEVENAELHSAENNTKSEDGQEQPAEEAADIENDKQPSSDDLLEEEVVAAASPTSPTPLDHKQKHEDLELDAPEPPLMNAKEMDLLKRDAEEEENRAAGGDWEESEAKRPHLEENSDGLAVTDNGFQEDEVENAELQSADNNTKSEDAQEQPAEEAADIENDKQPSSSDLLEEEFQSSLVENNLSESSQQQSSGAGEHQEPSAEDPQPVDVYSEEQQPAFETQTVSRYMEVPNNKVGVLIGKHGDTVRFLETNAGAKIKITRDADADPHSTTRPVELIGTLENMNKAERLIKDLIAEADVGGFPSLVARGFSNIHAAGAAEQILIQVPNEKVGLIIGKDGETIKNLQTISGARIQLTPQHLPEGDHSKERTVRVFGDKKQTEMAREMIKEVMNQTVTSSSLSGGYNQQQQEFRPCGPAQPQWGNHQGPPHPSQSGGYNYQQRGSYPPPSQNSQYALPPQAYGGINYPPQQMERRHPPSIMLQQGPGGYGHMGDVPASSHGHGPSPTPMGPPPPSQGNYNIYGPPQPAAPPYFSQAPHSHGHGHGYNEAKYDNQAPCHPSYGDGGSQPGPLGPGFPHPGYAPQDQPYGKAPVSYPQQQNGGLPQGTQPGDNISYHTSTVSVQATHQQYPQNAAPPPQSQQTYPQQYPHNAAPPPPQSQQTYPQTYPQPYGSDGYNINQQQLQPVATLSAAPVYPQQGPISGYGQPQALSGYAQEGPTGGYGSYSSGYTEPPTAHNTAAAAAGYFGYQGSVVPAAAYASAPTQLLTGQAVYAQPAPTQPPTGYEPYDHSGNYGSAPATYGKSLSPQPRGYSQHDATGQMLRTHR